MQALSARLDLFQQHRGDPAALKLGVDEHHIQMAVGFQVSKSNKRAVKLCNKGLATCTFSCPCLPVEVIGCPGKHLVFGIVFSCDYAITEPGRHPRGA